MKILLFALALLGLAAPGWAQDAARAAPAPATYVLTGFRSADFGAGEKDVRAAIKRDFGLSDDAVRSADNVVQKTKTLSVTVKDLLPDSGTAQVNYILGFKSKALVQVSVIWGGSVDQEIEGRILLGMAQQLVTHFAGQGYAVEATNLPLAEGVVLLFRGRDATGRMTLLTLDAPPTPEGADAPPRRPSLTLAYIADPEKPDVFQIDQGQF